MSQLSTSCVGQSGHRIFLSQNFGIGLGLSVIFPLCFQTKNLLDKYESKHTGSQKHL